MFFLHLYIAVFTLSSACWLKVAKWLLLTYSQWLCYRQTEEESGRDIIFKTLLMSHWPEVCRIAFLSYSRAGNKMFSFYCLCVRGRQEKKNRQIQVNNLSYSLDSGTVSFSFIYRIHHQSSANCTSHSVFECWVLLDKSHRTVDNKASTN
jgi:hypothetical protein